MDHRRTPILRATAKAHLTDEVAAAAEVILGNLFDYQVEDGELRGTSLVLARGRAAFEELEMTVAALEEVHETAEASSLSGRETVVAGRVVEVLPALRRALETLREAFEHDE